jgi:type IV pilus assembly protein PilV
MKNTDFTGRILPARHGEGGFTMVEVLIAVLVLSIGLIGLASLQGVSLQFNNSAYLRSQATNLAYDITDRMRANRGQAIIAGSPYNIVPGAAIPAPGTLAQTDLNEWLTALQNTLPAGTGGVAVVPGGNVTILVCWDDSRGVAVGGAPVACPANLMGFRVETQL